MFDVIRDISKIGPHPGGSKEERKVADYFARSIEQYCDKLIFDEFGYIDIKGVEKKSVNVVENFGECTDNRIIICNNLDTIRDLE